MFFFWNFKSNDPLINQWLCAPWRVIRSINCLCSSKPLFHSFQSLKKLRGSFFKTKSSTGNEPTKMLVHSKFYWFSSSSNDWWLMTFYSLYIILRSTPFCVKPSSEPLSRHYTDWPRRMASKKWSSRDDAKFLTKKKSEIYFCRKGSIVSGYSPHSKWIHFTTTLDTSWVNLPDPIEWKK